MEKGREGELFVYTSLNWVDMRREKKIKSISFDKKKVPAIKIFFS
jgi:hypothetical protein